MKTSEPLKPSLDLIDAITEALDELDAEKSLQRRLMEEQSKRGGLDAAIKDI